MEINHISLSTFKDNNFDKQFNEIMDTLINMGEDFVSDEMQIKELFLPHHKQGETVIVFEMVNTREKLSQVFRIHKVSSGVTLATFDATPVYTEAELSE